VDVFTITLVANSPPQTIDTWFDSHVDIDGILRNAGTFSKVTLPSGSIAYLLTGSVPIQAGDHIGPVADAYVMSHSGAYVGIVMGGQENPLYAVGFSPELIAGVLAQVVQTLGL
jgi:hypothetical protein